MRPVRIWFRKVGTAKYISHLDLNRCMTRAIHRAKIPLWYTQGFNPRAFLTFALPLSLGVAGERESVDIKMDGEDMPDEEIIRRLNEALPDDIPVFAVTEPVMKPGKIAYASYEIDLHPEGLKAEGMAECIRELLQKEPLMVLRHTKSGEMEFDLHPYLGRVEVSVADGKVHLGATLPAGSDMNVNPSLFLDAVKKELAWDGFLQIRRTNLFNAQFQVFE